MLEDIPQRIKKKREKDKLKRIDLAKLAGIDVSWISRIERGQAIPSVSVAIRIARALKDKEEDYKNWAIEARLKKDEERSKKRSLIYHSPLSADEIEVTLKKREDEINKLWEEEVINKNLLERLNIAAAGPVKLDFKAKESILKQLGLLEKDKK